MPDKPQKILWSAAPELGGYEITSKGDIRFSALGAKMPDGRTLECWYQCDVKGYNPGGTNFTIGKGKPPMLPYKEGELYQAYKALWRIWAVHNVDLMKNLLKYAQLNQNTLSDRFAHTDINQARALSEILNEWLLQIED